MLIQNLTFFLVMVMIMISSSIFLVKSLTKIARFLRITEFSAAFIIMAVATSSPELMVGITSALSGVPTLSLGNLLGASIVDLTLITGIFILFGGEVANKNKRMNYEVYYTLLAAVFVIVLFLIGDSLSRIDGVILLSLFVFNFIRVMKKRKKYPKKLNPDSVRRIGLRMLVSVSLFLLSFIILVLAARFAVKYGSALASDLNVPKMMVGLFMVSFATVLPEFVFGIEACKSGHKGMAIGDITGGIFTNLSLVMGVVAIISPIRIDSVSFIVPALFLLVSIMLFLNFLGSKNKLGIGEGIGLIFFYIIFLVIELFIKF